MTKQEQIEKMAHIMCEYYNKGFCANGDITEICEDMPYCCYKNDAEALYDKGYGNVSEYKAERELLGSRIKVLEQRLNNKYIEVDNLNRDYHNSFERLKAQEREIERLKEEYAKLQEQFAKYQLASGKEILAQVKQAKIDMLNEVKKCSQCDNFFPDGKWHRYVLVSDIDDLIEEIEEAEQ